MFWYTPYHHHKIFDTAVQGLIGDALRRMMNNGSSQDIPYFTLKVGDNWESAVGRRVGCMIKLGACSRMTTV
jgi:hypothetical protein